MQISTFDIKADEKEVGTPSSAFNKCVCIVLGKAMREKDKGLLEDVEHFEKLLEAGWNFHISHYSIMSDRKHKQPKRLPLTDEGVHHI